MKRITIALAGCFCLVFLFIGCQKDKTSSVDPPIPPVVNDSIILKNSGNLITSNGVNIPWDGDFQFSWGYKGTKAFEIKINNISFSKEKSGNWNFSHLQSKMDFSFYLDNNKVSNSLIVAVGENPDGTIGFTYIPPDPIPYNTASTIGYIFTGDSCVITNNKNSNTSTVVAPKSGSYNTGLLTEWTIFTFTVWKNGHTITGIAGVHVNPAPILTTADSLKASWLKNDVLYRPKDSTNYKSVIVPCQKDDILVLMDNWVMGYHEGSNICFGNIEYWTDTWSMLPNRHFMTAGQDNAIMNLSDSTLVVTHPETGSGGTFKIVYKKQ
ncbi:MAG: hypothetical protein WCK34_04210 [Bacteroidota bacterium]